jgi:hypothetical protein
MSTPTLVEDVGLDEPLQPRLKLLEALKAFQAAAYQLNQVWAEVVETYPDADPLVAEYPFHKGFDRMVDRIDLWVEANL